MPRRLPDKSWGAALLDPARNDLPADLVGCSIKVTPRTKGDPWITTITEVVETGDKRILVRHSGRPGFPASPGNTPKAPAAGRGQDDSGTTTQDASPPSREDA